MVSWQLQQAIMRNKIKAEKWKREAFENLAIRVAFKKWGEAKVKTNRAKRMVTE